MRKIQAVLFSCPMVKAILENGKTQMWQPVRASNSTVSGYRVTAKSNLWVGLVWDARVFVDKGPHILHPSPSQYLHVPYVSPSEEGDEWVYWVVRSKWEIGDRLWVKESFWAKGSEIHYEADWEQDKPLKGWKWKDAIHLSQWASRLTVEITAIQAECIQDIWAWNYEFKRVEIKERIP